MSNQYFCNDHCSVLSVYLNVDCLSCSFCVEKTSSVESAQSNDMVGDSDDTEMQASNSPMQIELVGTEQPTSSRSLQIESIEMEQPMETHTDDENCPEFDVGKWLGKSAEMNTAQKSDLINRRWVPSEGYNFHAESDDPQRRFSHNWLNTYAPWLTYSKKLKGALCIYCVLFPQPVVQGVLGAFAVKAFTKYKDMHTSCRNHASSQWHRISAQSAKDFIESVPVDMMMMSGYEKQIELNRTIVSSIIKTVIFCGAHDMALRGKGNHEGGIFR